MQVKDFEIVRRYHADPLKYRLVLLCGPNATRCQALVDEIIAPLSGSAERVDLTAASVSDDTARLNDEATSASLFGDKRFIVLRLHSGESVRAAAAIDNLLASENHGDPVFVIAPGMADKTALAKSIAKSPYALIATCYETNTADAVKTISDMARHEGVRMSRDTAAAIADLTSNDLVLARMEVEKIALYLDATPDVPKEADTAILAELGAENDEENLGLLFNAALNGDIKIFSAELAASTAQGFSEVGLIRIMLMHLAKLAELRAKVDQGARVDAVAGHPSVFWKQRKDFSRQLNIWSSANIARLIERMLAMEIAMKSSGQPSGVLLENELLTIVRKAARGR